MAHKTFTVAYRRKRKGKTDYHTRLKLISSQKPRLVIRRFLKNLSAQIIEYAQTGDKVVASAITQELAKHGWKGGNSNTPAAYLCGLLLGKKAAAKKVKEAVVDIGQHKSVKGCVLYAAIKGVIDAGLKVNCAPEMFPSEPRLNGEHIAQHAQNIKQNKELFEKTFSGYIKKGLDPQQLPSHFKETKTKIMGAK